MVAPAFLSIKVDMGSARWRRPIAEGTHIGCNNMLKHYITLSKELAFFLVCDMRTVQSICFARIVFFFISIVVIYFFIYLGECVGLVSGSYG